MSNERFWIAGAALVLMATACGGGSDITGPSPAIISSKTNEQDVPFHEEVTNPCNNDAVIVDGTSHWVITITVDNALGYHMNSSIISRGTGLGATGKEYKVNDETKESLEIPLPPTTTTMVHQVVAIGPQQVDNFILQTRFHITINANGDISAFFDRFEAKCTG